VSDGRSVRFIGGLNAPLREDSRTRAFATWPLGKVVVDGDRIQVAGRGPIAAWVGFDRLDAPASEVQANRVVMRRTRGVRITAADGRWWILWTRGPDGVVDALKRVGASVSDVVETLQRSDVS